MKINIKEEVYKCSKCGLCKSVCPIYLATKNEIHLARGRYIILNNFFNNKKKLSRYFIKNLDICLNCNACKNFCPSNIDAYEIFTQLKSKYKYKTSIIPFHIKYKFNLINNFRNKNTERINYKNSENNIQKGNIIYFQGCVNKYTNSKDKNATINIIKQLGYNIVQINNNCCGLPLLSDGEINKFAENSKKIVNSIHSNIKYIVCSCDSCFNTLSRIPEIKEKLITIDKLLELNNFNFKIEENILYHKPLNRITNCYFPQEITLSNRKGCCSLMENFFMLKHRKEAEEVLNKVFYKKEEINNKTIITTCNLDNIGLKANIKKIKSNTQVYSYSEYINILTQKK